MLLRYNSGSRQTSQLHLHFFYSLTHYVQCRTGSIWAMFNTIQLLGNGISHGVFPGIQKFGGKGGFNHIFNHISYLLQQSELNTPFTFYWHVQNIHILLSCSQSQRGLMHCKCFIFWYSNCRYCAERLTGSLVGLDVQCLVNQYSDSVARTFLASDQPYCYRHSTPVNLTTTFNNSDVNVNTTDANRSMSSRLDHMFLFLLILYSYVYNLFRTQLLQ